MSRELTNGAHGWRFIASVAYMPIQLALDVLDLDRRPYVPPVTDWTDGTWD